MVRLTLAQQRILARSIPRSRVMAARQHCRKCQMQGEGLGSIFRKISRFLGPIVTKLGPTVLKELLIPLVKKKLAGGGKPKKKKAKKRTKGGALRLAGKR